MCGNWCFVGDWPASVDFGALAERIADILALTPGRCRYWRSGGVMKSEIDQKWPLSCPDGCNQTRNADQSDSSPHIVGERGQAEFAADILDAAHQKSALIHPLFDGAEGVLDNFAPAIEEFGPGFDAFRHALQHFLALEACDHTMAA